MQRTIHWGGHVLPRPSGCHSAWWRRQETLCGCRGETMRLTAMPPYVSSVLRLHYCHHRSWDCVVCRCVHLMRAFCRRIPNTAGILLTSQRRERTSCPPFPAVVTRSERHLMQLHTSPAPSRCVLLPIRGADLRVAPIPNRHGPPWTRLLRERWLHPEPSMRRRWRPPVQEP